MFDDKSTPEDRMKALDEMWEVRAKMLSIQKPEEVHEQNEPYESPVSNSLSDEIYTEEREKEIA